MLKPKPLSDLLDESGNPPVFFIVTPKSYYSRRSIVLSPKLKEALELHKINGLVSPHDLVFCNRSGGPLEPRYVVKHQFFPALTRAGLRQVRFHDLRHTFATLLIHQGENVKFIQNQMGHASIATTMNVYGHLLPETHTEAGAKLDRQIFGEIPAGGYKSSMNSSTESSAALKML